MKNHDMVDRIRACAAEMRPHIAGFLSDLIRIPSLSGKENAVVQRIALEMRSAGFDDVTIDLFGNVQGRIGTGSRLIAYDAHVDTVDVGAIEQWDFDPFVGDFDGRYVRGRGASDQKSGMASMVYAGHMIKKLDLLPAEFTLLMTGTVSEEDCDGLCWRYILEKTALRPEMVLITEPTSCRLYRGQRGRMEMTAAMPGVSAHGSAPERGKNAITAMIPVITGIEHLHKTLPCDPFLGRGSITISRIRSTTPSLCSVADSCEIYIDRRLTFGETPESALQQIQNLDPSKKLKVEIVDYAAPTHTGFVYPVTSVFPAWITPRDHPIVLAGCDTCRTLFNCEDEPGSWTFSTNGVSIAGLHGIPCIGFGPGDEEMAHAPNEKVAVDDLETAALFYAFYPLGLLHRTA